LNNKLNRKIYFFGATLALIALFFSTNSRFIFAEMMSSSSYKIQSDSVNIGGKLGASASYIIEDTLGEIATGESGSTNFKIKAGYQQMQSVYLAMTGAADVTMSPQLGGLSGGTSNGSTATTVTTDSPAGYQLSIKASSTPAMQGDAGNSTISDYTPAGADPDFTFSVPVTAGEFGFSPEGNDIAQKFKDDGAACNTGSGDTADSCWGALSTSNQAISSRSSANTPSGTATTIKFRITLGASHFQLEDTYTATTTITAVSL
jgi:hypothetical protein